MYLPFCRTYFYYQKITIFWFQFHWGLFARVSLTRNHWFRLWLDCKEAYNHQLISCWSRPLILYYITRQKLEIVDQWSTRIPPPQRRGWQWKLNIVQNHKAAILKSTQLTIVRLLPTATKDMHIKFETEIPKQTWVALPKPCLPETEKTNMATRQPFRKWGHWKSIVS